MVYQAAAADEPTREEVDRLAGPVLLEFGAAWCPHCLAVQKDLQELLAARPEIQHLKIEDGRGKPLGRSFRVKLWPTLILLQAGQVLAETVRPSAAELRQLLA